MKQKVFVVFVFSLMLFFSCASSTVKIKVVEKEYDFGVVYVNYSDSHDFVLENKTNNVVNIISASIDGSNEFIVTAGGAGAAIQPKGLLNVTVKFEPVDKGFEQAILIIVHSESNKEIEIKLEATGETKPEFDINLPSYDYGKLSKGLKGNNDFIVTNIGTAVLSLNSIAVSGPDSSEFTITAGDTVPVNIDPGNSHTITIEWASVDPVGMKSAYLDIIHNAEGSPESITLSAETLAYPPLVIVTTTMPDATNWTAYDELVQTTGGAGSNTFSIKTGQLPDGLSLDTQTGKISGTPHCCGKEDFEIEVDDNVTTVSKMISLEVLSKNTWENVTPSGVALSGAECIAVYNHKLYYFSGYSYSYDIRIFDPIAKTWKKSNTQLSYHHQLGGACAYGNYIYIFAGSKTNSVERYDPATDSIATDTSHSSTIYDFATGVYNNEIYCISSANSSTGAWKFKPGPNGTNGTWTTLPNTTTGCFGAGMTVYNNEIVLFGGTTNLTKIRTYNPTTGVEANFGSLISGADRFAYGRVGDIIYLGDGGSSQFQKFDLSTKNGGSLASAPASSTYFGSQYTECDGRIYVSNKSNTIYAYTP